MTQYDWFTEEGKQNKKEIRTLFRETFKENRDFIYYLTKAFVRDVKSVPLFIDWVNNIRKIKGKLPNKKEIIQKCLEKKWGYIITSFERFLISYDVGYDYTNRHRFVCTYLCLEIDGEFHILHFEGDNERVIDSRKMKKLKEKIHENA